MCSRMVESIVDVPENVVLTYLVEEIRPAERDQRLRVYICEKDEYSFAPAAAHQLLECVEASGVYRGHVSHPDDEYFRLRGNLALASPALAPPDLPPPASRALPPLFHQAVLHFACGGCLRYDHLNYRRGKDILERVHRFSVERHFIVQMWSAREAC